VVGPGQLSSGETAGANRAAWFTDVNHGWYVADGYYVSTPWHTADGGGTWAAQGSSDWGNGIMMASPTVGWKVFQGGAISRTLDGSTWSAQSSGSSANLYGVYAPETSTAWVVGSGGPILHTMNGGVTWALQTNLQGISAPSNYTLSKVWFADDTTGWVAGSNGLILSTRDGGTTWTTQHSGGGDLGSIKMFDGAIGYAAGGGSAILKTVDGTNWNALGTGNISGLWAVDANTVWVCDTSGNLKVSTDGGATFTTKGSTGAPGPIYAPDRNTVLCLGTDSVRTNRFGNIQYGSDSYQYLSSPAWTVGDRYQVQSYTVDRAGNTETAGAGSTFTYQPPSSKICHPWHGHAYRNQLASITGTATSGAGISKVEVEILDSAGNCWNGSNCHSRPLRRTPMKPPCLAKNLPSPPNASRKPRHTPSP